MPEDFSFEEDLHIYRNAAGIIRSSVTQCLREQTVFDFSMVPQSILENARRRGSNVHAWTEEYDRHGSIDDSWIADDEMPYFEAWLKFRRESKCKIISIEQPMLCRVDGIEVGGTPDREVWLGAVRYILDLKCCRAKHPGWALQIGMYEMMRMQKARCGHMGRASVQLFPDASYDVLVYENPSDGDVAIACLTLTAWEEQCSDRDADAAREVLNAWKHNVGLAA